MPEQQTFLSMITGSFSTPAAENPTVAMIEAAYEHHHIDARYLNCDVAPDALGDAVRGARAMGWVGFNCSMPHKVSVIKYLDGLGSSAALIGAVNCVVRRENRYIGENTTDRDFSRPFALLPILHVEGRLDLDLDPLRPGLVVADVIPNPPRTQLIRDAEARGCIVLDGLGMLVSQGAIGIRYWTGIEPELQVMRRALEHIFGV